MEKNLLEKIKSKNIYQIIFDFIKYNNFKYLLFKYSKILQKKLDIELDDYKIKYIDKLNLNIVIYMKMLVKKNLIKIFYKKI